MKDIEGLVTALMQLAVRFPIEFQTDLKKFTCKCIQFEDNQDCRHLYALNELKKYEATQK